MVQVCQHICTYWLPPQDNAYFYLYHHCLGKSGHYKYKSIYLKLNMTDWFISVTQQSRTLLCSTILSKTLCDENVHIYNMSV